MTTHLRLRQSGFTLIELLIVLAIIAILAALIFAAFAPVRMKARETGCVSNLRQWGQAFAMYIQDYDGLDPVKGVPMTHSQLGLPLLTGSEAFMKTYKIWDTAVMRCPNDHRVPTLETPKVALVSYVTVGFSSTEVVSDPIMSGIVSNLGPDLPLLTCDQHNTDIDWSMQPTYATKRVLVLRMNQQIRARTIPARDIWQLWW